MTKSDIIREALASLNANAGLPPVASATKLLEFLEDRLGANGSTANLAAEQTREFDCQVVLNANYLKTQFGISPHLYLISAQFGSLGSLLKQVGSSGASFSYSVLFGEWDMLIVHWADSAQSEILYNVLRNQSAYTVSHMSVRQVPLSFGIKTAQDQSVIPLTRGEIFTLTSRLLRGDQDSATAKGSGAISGFHWFYKGAEVDRISAFIGVCVFGLSDEFSSELFLNAISSSELIRDSLLDFYEIESGRPYHFVLKVAVNSLLELDQITDFVGLLRVGRAKFDGATFIVANEKSFAPTLGEADIAPIQSFPDYGILTDFASAILDTGGGKLSDAVNKLEPRRVLVLLNSLSFLMLEFQRAPIFDDSRANILRLAVKSFSEIAALPEGEVGLTGPVMEVAGCVENYGKHTLRRLVDKFMASNYAAAQLELKLPTKDFRKLTLGKIIAAFEAIERNEKFAPIAPMITREMIELLLSFSASRNIWAHAGVLPTEPIDQIDEVRKIITQGIRLCRWLGSILAVMEQE